MNEDRITEKPSWNDPRGQEMKTPDEVAAMVRLKACGWGIKQIARELGCSHHTVRHYVAAGGALPFRAAKRAKTLDGTRTGCAERGLREDAGRRCLSPSEGKALRSRRL